MTEPMYDRWINNENYREYFTHKLDSFFKNNNLNVSTKIYDKYSHHAIRDVFENWLVNSSIIPIDNEEIKNAEDFNTPWDAFDYFFEKNKNNNLYFKKGYNQLWCIDFN